MGPRALLLPLVGPLASLLPLYLSGTLTVQLRQSIGFSVEQLGIVTGIFFATATITGIPLGRVATRLGSVRSMQVGVVISAVATGLTGGFAQSWVALAVCMAVNGLSQAFSDPPSIQYITRAIPSARQGLAFGFKLASIPAGLLICGLAVPLVAIPFGWRWAFVGVAVILLLSLAVVPRYRANEASEPPKLSRTPFGPLLTAFFVAAALGFIGQNVFASFVVSSATASGLSSTTAGLLVAAGGAIAATGRIIIGRLADHRPGHELVGVSIMLVVTAACFLAMATGTEGAHAVAIPLGFLAIWGWAPLYQLALSTRFREAPAAAFRFVSVGVYFTSVIMPPVFGWLAANYSFGVAWIVLSGFSVLAAVAFVVVGRLTDASTVGRWEQVKS